jgi:hypothetical protein
LYKDRCIIKKRKLDDDNESSVAGTSSGSSTHSRVSVSSESFARQYIKDYLTFGFISSREEQSRPTCVVSGENLENQAILSSKLKRHLHIKHSHLCEKPIEYFKRLIAGETPG